MPGGDVLAASNGGVGPGECGLACLVLAFRDLGVRISMAEARAVFQPDASGASIRELIDLADRLGFRARAFRAEPERYGQLPCPAILHWRANHYVLLRDVDDEGMTLTDPYRAVIASEDPLTQPWLTHRVLYRDLTGLFDGVFIQVEAKDPRSTWSCKAGTMA